MVKVFCTGSSDGIGLAGMRLLIQQGHQVTLHARNADRAKQLQASIPGAAGILIGDLSSIAETRKLAEDANKAGPWDTVVHNAGVGLGQDSKKTADGLPSTFQINSLAPYILTSLMDRPKRLLYVSSGLHQSGDGTLHDITWSSGRKWSGSQAYNDTKLQNVILANAVARYWPQTASNSLDPGWVKTKLGSFSAPGSLDAPAKFLAEYSAGDSEYDDKSGLYYGVNGAKQAHDAAGDVAKQEEYLKICADLSGVQLPK